MRKYLSVGLLTAVLALAATAVLAQGREEARLLTARQVLKELRASPDQFIPASLLSRAYGIAVVPSVTKAAFFFGASRGNGVLVVRNKYGRFSDPIFINLTGGSVGFQWGIQSTDVVLVFTSQRSIEEITSGKITLGADASIAAGPVGRQAAAATDPTVSSEIYSYSRSRGLFLGVALNGAVLTIDKSADARFYDRGVAEATAIVSGKLTTSDDIAKEFMAEVDLVTGTALSTPASASVVEPGAPNASAAPPAQSSTVGATSASGATTFPLADPHPGSAPPN